MPILASGAATGVSYVAETVWGVTPATPTMKTARVLPGSKFNLKRDFFQSNELRPDRQISDMRPGNKQSNISTPFQMTYGDQDDFLEAFMGGTWTANVLKCGNTLRSFTFENQASDVKVYERYPGCSVNEFNLSVQSNQIVSGSFGIIGKTLIAAETIGASITVAAIGKTFTRETGDFLADGWAVGMTATFSGFTNAGNNNTFAITTLTATVMTCSAAAGLVNEGPVAANAQLATLGAPTAPTTNSPYDSFTGSILEGGVAIAYITGIDLKGTNNLSPNFALMNDASLMTSQGRLVFTGTLSAYFVDQTLKKKFLNNTSTSLQFTLGTGSKMQTHNMPNLKFTDSDRAIGEKSIIENLPFQALYDAGQTSTLVITRTP